MTADLHLPVGTAEVFKKAIGPPSPHVTAAVETPAWLGSEGIRHEPLSREVGPACVAACQAYSTNPDLAGHPHRHRLQRRVEQTDQRSGNRTTNRGEIGPSGRGASEQVRRDDVAFSGAVLVPKNAAGDHREELTDRHADPELLAGDDHLAKRRWNAAGRQARQSEMLKDRHRQKHPLHALLDDKRQKHHRIEPGFLRHDHQFSSRKPGREHLLE